VLPAPASVFVDRFVGNGFVGPRTDRPVSGVCASSRSLPVPPAGRDPVDAERFLARAAAARSCSTERFDDVFFFPRGVFAPAVFRPVLRRAVDTRRGPAPPRADARAPAPARFFDRVRFCALLERFLAELPALRPDAFLAMTLTPVEVAAEGFISVRRAD